jgi:hypothetical protein
LLQRGLVIVPTSPQSWTVKVELLSEGQVELHASLDGDDAGRHRRCSVQDALRELEVLFACTGDADFFLAVRAPDGPWCQLATRRWRLALYFITSQYERAFVGKRSGVHEREASRPAAVSQASGARRVESKPLRDVREAPSFAEQSGLVSSLPPESDLARGLSEAAEEEG